MKLSLQYVTLKNFLSFGKSPTTVRLDGAGTTLIRGENLDDLSAGSGANGVGKTTIINAITYAIFGKVITKISPDNLVNNINKKHMEVIVGFSSNGVEFKVVRQRKMKAGSAGNNVFIYEIQPDGSEKDITPDSIDNTNKLITDIVGIDFELFTRIITFSANSRPFLDLPATATSGPSQTGLIEELVNLTILSTKAENLKAIQKEAVKSLEIQNARLELIEAEHARHSKQLENVQDQIDTFETDRTKKIKNLEASIEVAQQVDIEAEKKLHADRDAANDRLRTVKQELREHKSTLATVNTQIESTEGELEHLKDNKCPYCAQKFQDTDDKIAELSTMLVEFKEAKTEYDELVSTLSNEQDELTAKLDALDEQLTVENIADLIELHASMSSMQTQLSTLKESENPHHETLKNLQAVELDPINTDTINELVKEIDHCKFLMKLLTKKDSFIRKYLLNKYIPMLNERLGMYIHDLGMPHVVTFNHDLTASISRFGRSLDFGNLSNGQKARVNLALSFAFRDILQRLHGYINVCMLDEVLDFGLDSIGVINAAKMIKKKAKDDNVLMFVISHRDEIAGTFDNEIVVQLSGGFSSIKGEE